MKFAIVIAFGLVLAACAAFQKFEPFIPTPDQFACVETEAEAGTPALTIVSKCGFAADAAEAALAFIENFIVGHTKAKAAKRARELADAGAK